LLTERRGELAGNVKLMFQPAEEGGAGALRMIEDGLLEDPQVDAAFAQHVNGIDYTGKVALRSGPVMASADSLTITVQGKGGHAARPQLAVDPIVVASYIITALQTLLSREVPATEQAVLTIAHLEAGTTFNVIPDTARMRGTVRTYSPELQDLIERRINEIAHGIAAAMRATVEVQYERLYPVVINHEEGVRLMEQTVTSLLGPESAIEGEMRMGAEDFSYVLQRVPGAFVHLGVRHPSWTEPRATHSSSFDLDEEALPIGAALMTAAALRFLNAAD
jgi:amidohydrolase